MQWKLRTRVGMVFATLHVTLLLVMALMIGLSWNNSREQAAIDEIHAPAREATRQLGRLAESMLTDEFIYLKETGAATTAVAAFRGHEQDFERVYDQAARLVEPDEARALLLRIRQRFDAAIAANREMMALVAAGRLDEANAQHGNRSGARLLEVREDAETLYDLQSAEIQQLRQSAGERRDRNVRLAIAIALIGPLVAVLLWRGVLADIIAPLQALRRSAEAISHGEFVESHHPAAARTVELAALEEDFNRMSARLEDAAGRLLAANATLESQVESRTEELSEANARLQALVSELQALDQLKSNFMAVMSHELLTPINFIVGFGSALEDELLGPLNDKQKETLGKMMAGADRLTRMVRNTLEYTRLQSGELTLHPEPVDYAALVADFVDSSEPALAARRQTLVVERPDDLPAVLGDADRLQQVLYELVDNASKFAPEGAEVKLRLSADAAGVATDVIDTGIGMDSVAVSHLFKPFYQADFSLTREHGGMGLGLAIAHHLVLRMGGEMRVTSRPGRGTTVRFTLPRADVATPGPVTFVASAPSEAG